ncbi:44093_t:CDS:2 [Gigaspora margarita]|uniref:44093_t:CDS:1 n=1 Tax=Gigaspora margarita TaxID=4874 RepID=A0ABN7V8R6_GIGMA|nr:44093_t:CDS:2 [Gigaspora margarita]
MDLRTGSDHQAVFVQLEIGLNLRKRSQAENSNLSKELKRNLSKDIGKENVQRDISDHQLLGKQNLE